MTDVIKILYVDDEQSNLNAFKAHLRVDNRLKIHTCLSGEEGLTILQKEEINIVISDQKMAKMTGIEFLTQAQTEYPEIVTIVVTAHRDLQLLEEAKNKGAIFSYHDKPWDMNYLEKLIFEAFNEYLKRKSMY